MRSPVSGWRFGLGARSAAEASVLPECAVDDLEVQGGAAYASEQVSLSVTLNGQDFVSSSAHSFTYGVPRVSSVQPTTGAGTGGLLITVLGSGFDGGTAYRCRFGSVSVAANLTAGVGSLQCLSPPRATTELLTLEVSLDAGATFTNDGATYFSMAPVLSAVTPQSSPIAGGSQIKLFGSEFGAGLGPLYLCKFGNTFVEATYDSAYAASGGAGEALVCDSPNSTIAQPVDNKV